jgi:molybdopterin molybdotransferase
MRSVDDALDRILQTVRRLEPRALRLADLCGLVLAENIVAAEDLPPVANSAMDGYAVVAADTNGAAPGTPRALKITDTISAGCSPDRALMARCAARIMTGAPLPEGADAIVRVEHTVSGDDGAVAIQQAVSAGRDVRPAGEDVRCGEMVLKRGTVLRPAEIAMLAALGCPSASVFPHPRVGIVTTGNELVDPGAHVPPGHVRDSNRYSLAAQVVSSGGRVCFSRRASDEMGAIEEALSDSSGADLILTSGGVSVGDFDLVTDGIARVGRIHFSKVAIRPGKPLVFGEIRGTPIFGLPGNPVSSMVAFEVFVRPTLDQMRGMPPPPRFMGRLAKSVEHKAGRRSYLRARAFAENGAAVVHPVSAQGTGQISSLVQANALAVIPEDRDRMESGELVEIVPLWPRGSEPEAFQAV